MRLVKRDGGWWFDGKPIRDATTSVLLRLKDESDLTGSDSRHPRNCVWARCALRINGVLDAYFGAHTAYLLWASDDQTWIRYRYAGQGGGKIRSFDEVGDSVRRMSAWLKGQTLILAPPHPYKKLGARHGDDGGKRKTKTGSGRTMNRLPSLRNIFITPEGHDLPG